MTQRNTFVLKIAKRLLDAGIIFYVLFLLIIILTGGFELTILGVRVRGTHVLTPFRILLPLFFLRLLITVKLKDMLLIIVSVVICLAAIEFFIQIWDPPVASSSMVQIHRASPMFGWELIPGSYGIGSLGETYQINSLGFRDKEFLVKKPLGISRIMVIGDSFTFGMGANLEDTYPKQIERIIQKQNIHCEVINCGVIGYNMWQYLEALKKRVLPLEPDLVVLGLFEDDIAAAVSPHKTIQNWQGSNPFEPSGSSKLMANFALWNFVKNASAIFEYRNRAHRGSSYMKGIEERKKVWGPTNPADQNYRIMSGIAGKKLYDEFCHSLSEFVSECKTAGAHVLIVMIPDSVQLNDPHMQAVNRIVDECCQDIGVLYLDLTPVLETQKNPESLYLFPFDAHNSPIGLQLIAEAICDKIISLNLLFTKS